MQLPVPSHAKSVSVVVFLQLELHAVEAEAYSHLSAKAPLQVPPQVVPAPVQAARGAWGGAPTTTLQVPLMAWSHAWHCPSQAVSQQYPSTQWPVSQVSLGEHLSPWCRVAAVSTAARSPPKSPTGRWPTR
jgi:hypothetical protein